MTSRASADTFVDPLDAAALPDIMARKEILVAVAQAGPRLVAAGLRGLIIYSDDRGASWKQAAVPVQSDLTALDFLDARQGWATGQDGVILHTLDGGSSWTRQFDGRGNLAFVDFYQKRVDQGDATAKPYVDAMKLNTHDGPDLPYLDVLFENDHDGYAVGPFGMLIVSHDGGAHWSPWLDHIDNPQFLYLNSLARIDGDIYIAGEKGKVYRLDRTRGQFVAMDTGYAGSLFGITGTSKALLAYGLLGHAFRSLDKGQHWQEVSTGVGSSIGGGMILAGDRAVLVTGSGQLLTGSPEDGALKPVTIRDSFPLSGVTSNGEDSLALVGLGGVAIRPLP